MNLGTIYTFIPNTLFCFLIFEFYNVKHFEGMDDNIQKIKMNSLLLFHFWYKEETLVDTEAILEILEAL